MYALSWKLLLIGLHLEYFATLLKILHLKKIARKCSIFLHQLYFFLMGRSRTLFFWIRIKFHLGRAKGRGKRGYGGEAQNEVYFCKFPLVSKIPTLSHKLLVRQTSNHYHCNWHAQKLVCRDFQVILSSSSNNLCVFLRKKYGFQIGKCYGKNKLYFDQEEIGNAMEKNKLF